MHSVWLVAVNRTCVLLGLLTACAAPPRPVFTDADYPGTLLPPSSLGAELVWQQRVTAHWGDAEQRGFDAALQRRGDTLTVIGLSPLGQAGFVITLRDGVVALTNQTDMEVPFPPRFVLLDVQRTFYPWLPALPPGEVADGQREAIVGGERVRERRVGGRLVERTFTRLDGKPVGTITVTYDWADTEAGRLAPKQATLHNGWFGYRMVIDTHAETVLPSAAK